MQITNRSDESMNFPAGTILVKPFYYLHDERDRDRGKHIIETALLINANDLWNVATKSLE